MQVKQAVILASGFGTGMLPATKAVPLELLPLSNTPAIEFVVDELLDSGIEQIIVVTAAHKRSLEEYFSRNFELEALLERQGDIARFNRVRRIWQSVEIAFVREHEHQGSAHALLAARAATSDEPFVLVFPDDIFAGGEIPATRQLIEVFNHYEASVVCVERVPLPRLADYELVQASRISGDVYRVGGLGGEATRQEVDSDLCLAGRYVLTPSIFEAIARAPVRDGGRIHLTDGLSQLLEFAPLYGSSVTARHYSIRHPIGFLKAAIEVALARSEFNGALGDYLFGTGEDTLSAFAHQTQESRS